ncbi:tRNA (5-methylaminomethyl-2-thiouridine)(34)-methyltransferase MnmD [Dysgonomonas sp. BGC7]|uniref:tRNA (5-methylaminomethyl-2-thiouridine)(34)-methyltransferase MnmD n=1 Tax=Dysgonomonas sp. BGC7 TaxID=1658008 RepID=UPI0006832B77|nr:tRNA (5-methylaminomethyl-2-thiouridine)(34)-methyltransferase MnmD [Dysgonomonas sp. BGC7]MBD8390194.1 tRNA (5-methylaminomethyl-2-thiouridine)(34)-methyltransferase MnmD [Dysgonomonas sp. BGC7]
MSVKPEIELTSDGSHTLFVPTLNEHYHSTNGAVQESVHIFINTGFQTCRKEDIKILEVGFGTGLNTFLTLLESQKESKAIHYTGIELYPLPFSIISKLNYTDSQSSENKSLFYKLHECDWNEEIQITPQFHLKKIQADLTSFDLSSIENIDIIYFDAFAPDKQPDMWTQEIFDKLYSITTWGGILVTYCAKGVVRRMMQQAGYEVERLPGPPGKREMLRAKKPEQK